jgi:hypothetical protein
LQAKRYILAIAVIGFGAFVWSAYRTLKGTTYSGEASSINQVPHVGTSLDWLGSRRPVVYVVHDAGRGPFGFVSGEASGNVAAAAKALGFRSGFAESASPQTLSKRISGNDGDPRRFTTGFGDDDPVYIGSAGNWNVIEVYYRESDRRFTARLVRATH